MTRPRLPTVGDESAVEHALYCTTRGPSAASAASAGRTSASISLGRQRPRDPGDADDVDLVGGALRGRRLDGMPQRTAGRVQPRPRELQEHVDAAGEVVAVERDPQAQARDRPEHLGRPAQGRRCRERVVDGLARARPTPTPRACSRRPRPRRRDDRGCRRRRARAGRSCRRPRTSRARARPTAPTTARARVGVSPSSGARTAAIESSTSSSRLVELVADAVGVQVVGAGEARELLPRAERDARPGRIGRSRRTSRGARGSARRVAAQELDARRARPC